MNKAEYSPRSHNAFPRRLAGGLVLLYEDRDILVVDKPAGLLSIAAGSQRDKTAYCILAEYLRTKGGKQRPAAVHRLDRDTSGIMLFAKSEPVKKKLMASWKKTVAVRRYTALVEGLMTETQGIVDAPLAEDRGGRMIVQEGGIPAVTKWELIRQGKGHALLRMELETGRRNQIRAHMAFLKHPVAGDRKYAAKSNPCKRLALHAETLSFYHPADGRLMEFNSPCPFGLPAQNRRKRD
ncbi:MAG: RluA family pseudouridine synthase [Treponema sp.]|jgi:23S rRNA pseudouridine1911/1915/1917 synthase|nr:RluA family pseudouridine synthase [Treponema sp.]